MGRLKNLAKNAPGVKRVEALAGVGEVATVGLSFVFALAIGAIGGWWLDQHFGWKPWGFLTGLAFGLAAGAKNVYTILRKYMK
jgi:ATP synthase protein I